MTDIIRQVQEDASLLEDLAIRLRRRVTQLSTPAGTVQPCGDVTLIKIDGISYRYSQEAFTDLVRSSHSLREGYLDAAREVRRLRAELEQLQRETGRSS